MVYTFYSYKGGVGRTMALANIADLFYQSGLRVLMIDWDLESPGLERFFSAPERADEILGKLGVMEMLLEYKRRMAKPPSAGESVPSLSLFEDPQPYIVDVSPESAGKGRLLLLPAGRRIEEHFTEYVKAVMAFDWKDFYQNWEGERYLEWLRQRFEEIADVILIDSRTGVTEIGGVCTYQLADVIVILCAANQQNLDGAYRMASDFKRPEVRKLRGDRSLEVLVVPARIEQAEGDKLNQFKQDFLRRAEAFVPMILKRFPEITWTLAIPYVPYYAYNETIAIREREKAIAEPLVRAFERLAHTLSWLAPSESLLNCAFSVERLQKLGKELDPLVALRSSIMAISEKIDALHGYKHLHDLLQELEDVYSLINQELKRLPTDTAAWNSLEIYNFELQNIFDRLLVATPQASSAIEEGGRLQQLGQLKTDLQEAIAESNFAKMKSAMQRLDRLLAREPSRINRRLVATANALHLDKMVEAMTNVRDTPGLRHVDQIVLRQLIDGVTVLGKLNASFMALVNTQDACQSLDDHLRMIEVNLDRDVHEIELSWPTLATMINELYGDNTADWAKSLKTTRDELKRALSSQEPTSVARLFWRLRGQTSRRFRQVDFELLETCGELKKLVEPLDLLLRMAL